MTRPRLVGLSANIQRPSKTRTLVDAVLRAACAQVSLDARVLDFVEAGPGLGAAWTRDQLPPAARAVLDAIEEADGLVVGSPVYKGAYTGLFKHLFDLVDPAALAGKPVAIVATGGGARHALVVEHAFRPLFGFFGALQIPTAVYASDADFREGVLVEAGVRARVAEAGGQLAALLAHRAATASVTLAAAE
ncbi:FMN reductase [Methylobacterium phyllostachyos]|uniref:FMN reductase n=1 Tax=Methylobacterium phyllostachyos TaxID=582672 RepID=A0A1H0DHF9_9HYPH|nr:FMN reductase [Methylobacterium phyllostachyos]SDN69514.1 FMN reductase [Methylobacterium phyllostachyos]